jgi:hypothetical protein
VIDFSKIHALPVEAEKVRNNPLLTLPLSNIAETGEMLNRPQTVDLKGIKISVRAEQVSLQGSLHKFHENGTNYQDYSLADIRRTINELAQKLQFDPEKAFINFIEVGVNIQIDRPAKDLIKTAVIYRNKEFKPMFIKQGTKGYGKQAETQRFVVKIYDKGLQYNLDYNLLRFELKVIRTAHLKRYGIFALTLADLTRPEVYPKFLQMLLDSVEGILMYDPDLTPDNFDGKDRELFIEGRYAEYWQGLTKATKNRKITRFKELAGTADIIKDFKKRIEDKWNQLTDLRELDTKLEPINRNFATHEARGAEPINPNINSYSVPICPVTGLELKDQKPGTRYLTYSGIEWYFNNEPEIYQYRLKSLLTHKWVEKHSSTPKQKIWTKIAHQIRNRLNNPRNNPRNNTKNSYRKIQSKGLTLFDIEPFIPESKKKYLEEIIQ